MKRRSSCTLRTRRSSAFGTVTSAQASSEIVSTAMSHARDSLLSSASNAVILDTLGACKSGSLLTSTTSVLLAANRQVYNQKYQMRITSPISKYLLIKRYFTTYTPSLINSRSPSSPKLISIGDEVTTFTKTGTSKSGSEIIDSKS